MKGEVRGRLASQLAGVTMTLTQLLGAVMTGVSSPGACKAEVGGRTGEEGAGGESLRRLGAQTVPHVKAFGVPSCCGWAVGGRVCVSTFSFPPVSTLSPPLWLPL